MPGASNAAPSVSVVANEEQQVFLSAGTHSIKRSGNLIYQPKGLSIGETIFCNGEVLLCDNGETVSWTQAEGEDSLNYYGTLNCTGPTAWRNPTSGSTAGRMMFVWNIPDGVKWHLKDVGCSNIEKSTSNADLFIFHNRRFDGSDTKLNALTEENSTFLRADSGGGGALTYSYYSFISSGRDFAQFIGDRVLMSHMNKGTLVLHSGVDHGAGDQYQNFYCVVEEEPIARSTIVVDIEGQIPLTLGGDEARFTIPDATHVKYTPSASGIYDIQSL